MNINGVVDDVIILG